MPNQKQRLLLRELWARCNSDMFGGRLRREPRFHVFDSARRAGYFSPGGSRDHIGVNSRYFRDLPFSDLIDTIAHECVHQEQRELNLPIEHDDYFRKRCAELALEPV